MEQEIINDNKVAFEPNEQRHISSDKPFILANTIQSNLQEVRNKHIIPVFIKDNEPVISHHDFIETTMDVVRNAYAAETILEPNIRLSHPVKGRIPEAKDKAAKDLLEHEKTLYYERMAFIIEVPSIADDIEGNQLSLTIGGVKSYGLDNLYNRKGVDEHFKVFVGFKNTVCTNLCVWTDGYLGDLKIKNLGQLRGCILSLVENYNAAYQLHALRKLSQFSLSERQFALLIGRCRMFNCLPLAMKHNITPLMLSDTQLSMVVKDYYKDDSFCRDEDGNINIWKLYNLFTGANKSSYIDTFIDRSVNTFTFVSALRRGLDKNEFNWFLN
jgi:hypothetical protein